MGKKKVFENIEKAKINEIKSNNVRVSTGLYRKEIVKSFRAYYSTPRTWG